MLNNLYAWFWLLLSIHFIRPGLALRGGDGKRSHRAENCSSRSVPLLWEPVKAESRTRAVVRLQAERLPSSASSHSCASSAPQNCDSRSPMGFKIASKCLNVKTPDMISITKLTVFCAKGVELSRPIPRYSISLQARHGIESSSIFNGERVSCTGKPQQWVRICHTSMISHHY